MSEDVLVRTLPTPNPQAIKFVVNKAIKETGKATFEGPDDTKGLRLAEDLFAVSGVIQLHMFENVVTVTYAEEADPQQLKDNVIAVLKSRLPVHDPSFVLEEEKKKDRSQLSPELQQIEEILDRTIRPALQADGGDLDALDYDNEEKILEVRYQGACGSCPSSMFGTLEAIRGILKDEFDPEIEIMIG